MGRNIHSDRLRSERQHRYSHSEKGRLRNRRYEESDKAKARRRRYNNSPKGKARQRKYQATENAVSVETVLGLNELGYKFSGEYPAGHLLFDLQPYKNVFVHHGYMTRAKAGYQATAETDKRMVSTVTGHGERMGIVWRRDVIDRRIFGVEGGNLSRLGEPEIGSQIYTSVPFSEPMYLDRQQGIVLLYQDGDLILPVCVPIHKGKAIFNGKTYKA